jgi:hypothetical protein
LTLDLVFEELLETLKSETLISAAVFANNISVELRLSD